MSENQKTGTTAMWQALEKLAIRLVDGGDLQSSRIRAIEERLASLDGGPDAAASARSAFDEVNAARRRKGQSLISWITRP